MNVASLCDENEVAELTSLEKEGVWECMCGRRYFNGMGTALICSEYPCHRKYVGECIKIEIIVKQKDVSSLV